MTKLSTNNGLTQLNNMSFLRISHIEKVIIFQRKNELSSARNTEDLTPVCIIMNVNSVEYSTNMDIISVLKLRLLTK